MSKKISLSTVVNTVMAKFKSVTGDKQLAWLKKLHQWLAGLSACFNGALSFPLHNADGLGDRQRQVHEVVLLGDHQITGSLHYAAKLFIY